VSLRGGPPEAGPTWQFLLIIKHFISFYIYSFVHNITQNTFYSTIQADIDAALPGNEIQVSEGSYPEQVIIGAGLNGLKLIGVVDIDGKPTSVITPGVLGDGNGIRAIGSNNLEIKNFEITGAVGTSGETRGWGILVGNSSSSSITDGVLIDNIYSHNNAADGIRVRNTINATVQNCTSVNNSDGITFYARGSILNNTIGNHTMRGIYVLASGGLTTISGNLVYNCLNGGAISSSEGRVGGIIIYGSPSLYVTVENNEIYENRGPGLLVYKVNRMRILQPHH
jgi:hypothetical protein